MFRVLLANMTVDADVLSAGVRRPPARWGHLHVIQRRFKTSLETFLVESLVTASAG